MLLLLACCAATPLSAAEEVALLEAVLKRTALAHDGKVAIAVRDLNSGRTAYFNPSEPMPTASLIKLAVMVEAYRQAAAGELDLAKLVTLQEEDKVPGSGILTKQFSAGMQLSVRDAIRLMIAYSDNTATNLVLDQIGLPATAEAMEQLGFPHTKIHSKVYRGSTTIFPERSKEFGLGSTTAKETLELLEKLYRGELSDAAATKEMLDHLRACEDRNRIPKHLPQGTVVAHKTGSVNAVRTAAGIIEAPNGPLVVVVLTSNNKDQRWTDENAGEVLTAKIAQLAYLFFNPAPPPTNPTEDLQLGASGWLVEALQRTLNARSEPSPELSIDGDFGPATQQAVRQFQQSKDLSETGIVTAETWKALGPLLTSDVPITDPAEFKLTLSNKRPPDTLDGTPFVTCKAWIVGDATTGEILGSEQLLQKLENASTTKLMTAWIAMREIRKDPDLLEELATVSERAARTSGSTANVKTGEKLTVRDLLYGLLLPSGNDASVVIAEHFGSRFAPATTDGDAAENLSAYDLFIAEMNRTARELGMKNTQYRNSHGLSHKEHVTTVEDMFRLAATIAEDGGLLPYVSTRKHIGRLEGANGYVRYELWTNTNRLLNIDGYLGMKTGTTTPAGACLVSLAERDGQRLIAVVLGSSSSDARYTDTRNIFRWAWQQVQSR